VQTTTGTVPSSSSGATQSSPTIGITTSGGLTTSEQPTSSTVSASGVPQTTHRGGGLSGGVKAGIALGVICGIVVIAGVVLFISRHRKKNRKDVIPELEHVDIGGHDAPEVTNESKAERVNAVGLYKPLSATELPGQTDVRFDKSTTVGNREAGYSDLPEAVHELSSNGPNMPAQVESPPYSLLPEVLEGARTTPTVEEPDVARLEAELNRLDQEIIERERLQELKDQRTQMIARLRQARGGTS
jgi:hypothetical protein